MSPHATNVRAIRPMRILLVTDDVRYADELASAASQRGFDLAQAAVGGDLDLEATAQAPNVVVLDAHDALARTSRTATAFAALHPQIATVIVANRAAKRGVGSVLVFAKRRSTERLLGELERAYVGLSVSTESSHHSAEA
jgi:ActR/RegA family two-component response regulator